MRRQKRSAIFLSSPREFGFTLRAKTPWHVRCWGVLFFFNARSCFFYQIDAICYEQMVPEKAKGYPPLKDENEEFAS